MMDNNVSYPCSPQINGIFNGDRIISVTDIIKELDYRYMIAILMCSSLLLGYQLINMFVERTPERVDFFKWIDAIPTVPSLFLLVLSIAYFTGWGGI